MIYRPIPYRRTKYTLYTTINNMDTIHCSYGYIAVRKHCNVMLLILNWQDTCQWGQMPTKLWKCARNKKGIYFALRISIRKSYKIVKIPKTEEKSHESQVPWQLFTCAEKVQMCPNEERKWIMICTDHWALHLAQCRGAALRNVRCQKIHLPDALIKLSNLERRWIINWLNIANGWDDQIQRPEIQNAN